MSTCGVREGRGAIVLLRWSGGVADRGMEGEEGSLQYGL